VKQIQARNVTTQTIMKMFSLEATISICAILNGNPNREICDKNLRAIYVISLGESEYRMMLITTAPLFTLIPVASRGRSQLL